MVGEEGLEEFLELFAMEFVLEVIRVALLLLLLLLGLMGFFLLFVLYVHLVLLGLFILFVLLPLLIFHVLSLRGRVHNLDEAENEQQDNLDASRYFPS